MPKHYNMYNKNYNRPTKNEGFDNVIEIPFIPKFDDDTSEKKWKMWYL
jgi:hypothetical protein